MSKDQNSSLKIKFNSAVNRANDLLNQPPEILLKMYGLYKQALMGDITGKRPGRVKIKARYKYDAWASRKGMSQEEAMKSYIELIEKLENT
ncbi:MAG: acyl-CoA-binding protein [Candidatus Thorarchaeota archaeon]